MGITVTSRGRITLPKRVRDLLELGPGTDEIMALTRGQHRRSGNP